MGNKWEKVCKALCLVLMSSIKSNYWYYGSSDNLAHWFLANLTLRLILRFPLRNFLDHIRGRNDASTPSQWPQALLLRILLLQTLHQIISLVYCVPKKLPLQRVGLMEWTHQVKAPSTFPPNFISCPPWIYIPLVPAYLPSSPCCGPCCPQ